MIMVFGKTGQVAKELQTFQNTLALDRLSADLTSPEICAEKIYEFEPKAVINAAAYTAVDRCEKEEDVATMVNGYAPAIMAKACLNLNIPFIHISTDYVFNGEGKVPWKPSDLPSPKNAYGRSKLVGEKFIEEIGGTSVIIRTSWVVSSHGNNFIKKILKLSETQDILNVVSDQIGAPTFAHDIAGTCINIASQLIDDPKKSGIYHFSSQPNISWYEFAKEIIKKSSRTAKINPVVTAELPSLANRPLNSCLDCSDTENTFNILRPDWRNSLQNILSDLDIKNESA